MSELTQKLIKGKKGTEVTVGPCGTTEPHNQDLMVLTQDWQVSLEKKREPYVCVCDINLVGKDS